MIVLFEPHIDDSLGVSDNGGQDYKLERQIDDKVGQL